ncbi:MAG TPA: hypothetical protein VMD28_05890, partial [Acidimicrobiales bacterium]|nr:hypothetical protein [Acidimicrobiales bacterium]
RLAALETRASSAGRPVDEATIRTALAAHLCRCTGWQSIVEAAGAVLGVPVGPRLESAGSPRMHPLATMGGARRDPLLVAWRAQVEGGEFQISTAETVLGHAGFADDTAPRGALVAVPGVEGRLAVGAHLADARRAARKVQGRNSPAPLRHPLAVPEGEWAVVLRTTWVEPAYLEPDASWCVPGGRPATPLANGGAFGGKRRSAVTARARRLADEHGQPVRIVWAREDVVRHGPKRPPVALVMRQDGTGVLRVARTSQSKGFDAYVAAVAAVAPGLVVEPLDVAGPPVSADLRGAGWAEAAVAAAVLALRRDGATGGRPAMPEPGTPVELCAPCGGRARVRVTPEGPVRVEVWAGTVLDEVMLRSYCLGAVHQALGWVRSEGIAVDRAGEPQDLTIRSYGVLSARDTPWVDVILHDEDRWPVNGSDAVFAATAAAAWITDGLAPEWPTRRAERSVR